MFYTNNKFCNLEKKLYIYVRVYSELFLETCNYQIDFFSFSLQFFFVSLTKEQSNHRFSFACDSFVIRLNSLNITELLEEMTKQVDKHTKRFDSV